MHTHKHIYLLCACSRILYIFRHAHEHEKEGRWGNLEGRERERGMRDAKEKGV